MKNWIVELKARGKEFTKVKILRDIFQGDALSPLLFVIRMMPLNHILMKMHSPITKLSKSPEKINYLMHMDDIKLFAKKQKKILETLILFSSIFKPLNLA